MLKVKKVTLIFAIIASLFSLYLSYYLFFEKVDMITLGIR